MNKFWKRGVCLALTLVLCAGLLPVLGVTASALTLEERQQAIMAVAFAYFDKGHSVQYDGKTINKAISRSDYGKTRSTYKTSPETATPNETMYTVCSDFPCQVYWEAFRYELMGNEGRVWSRLLAREAKDDPSCVWYFVKDEGKNVKEEVKKMFEIAQPGDIYTEYAINGGHTMIWAGDITGDGKPDLIHSGGSHMDINNRKDVREYKSAKDGGVDARCGASFGANTNGGTIRINDAESYIANYTKGNRRWMTLLRPAKLMTDQDYPMRPATQYRMTHPRLAIDRTLNKTRFGSVYTGETVTMTLKLSNSSTQDYTVPVTEKAPTGAKIKTPFEGANVSGETMTFDVALKAGESKTFTAEFEITAKFGEKVVFDGGSVGDIPSNSLGLSVGGAKLNADDLAKLTKLGNREFTQDLRDNGATAYTLANVVYQKILGLNVQFPENKTVASKYLKAVTTPSGAKTHVFAQASEVKAEDLTGYRMLVPTCWGGDAIWCKLGTDRCSDPRDMHLEPGDVIVRSTDLAGSAGSEQIVYLGDGKYLGYNKEKNTFPLWGEPEFFRCLFYKVFYVLRPTLAYEDVHKLPALAADAGGMKFTDVKGNDWFYPYVKDLVEDGTVSGMTATTFAPNGTLTYGQALKLIALAVGEKEPAKSGSHWASGYLTLAKSKGWLTKDVDLDATITRLELCKLAAKAKGLSAQPKTNPFKDTDDKDVLALNNAGVINGMTATEFQPNGKLTRAQISKIICALREVVVTGGATEEETAED